MEEEKYTPPYELTSNMLELISEIMEKVGQINKFASAKSQVRLLKSNKINSIHSSLAIENNKLSISEVQAVFEGKDIIADKNEVLEVKNSIDAYNLMPDINPYSLSDLKKVHYEMMKGLCTDAGKFRSGAEGVFDGDTPIHIAPPAIRVPTLMADLFDYLSSSKENVLIKSCVFHYEFEYIHPFADGNGRTGRYWQTLLLSKWKPIFKFLPIENVLKEEQDEYYTAFRVSNSEGKSNAFIEFMLSAILKAISRCNIKPSEVYVSPQVEALMRVVDFYPRSSKELMSMLGLKSLLAFRQNYLSPALKENLIKMTIPEKPTSRNQRYYKENN